MNIQKIKLSDLNPAVYNPRKELKPGDPEFEKLKASIENFGYVELIVVNANNDNTVLLTKAVQLLSKKVAQLEDEVAELKDKTRYL